MRLAVLLILAVLTLLVRVSPDCPRARLPRGTYATEGRDPSVQVAR